MGFHGYAIGGLAVGEPQEVMLAMIETVVPHLPRDKPRYLMGVGTPDDILEAVARGIDMFDCVMPTRAGRHGLAFTRYRPINLRNAATRTIRARSMRKSRVRPRGIIRAPICITSSKSGEILGMMLLTEQYRLSSEPDVLDLRAAISSGRFQSFREQARANWARGDIEPATA